MTDRATGLIAACHLTIEPAKVLLMIDPPAGGLQIVVVSHSPIAGGEKWPRNPVEQQGVGTSVAAERPLGAGQDHVIDSPWLALVHSQVLCQRQILVHAVIQAQWIQRWSSCMHLPQVSGTRTAPICEGQSGRLGDEPGQV